MYNFFSTENENEAKKNAIGLIKQIAAGQVSQNADKLKEDALNAGLTPLEAEEYLAEVKKSLEQKLVNSFLQKAAVEEKNDSKTSFKLS
ncbi:MAG: hypothetical protein K0S11_1492 [Gammaproteobacteria bacterium]|jgi:hypothetical protein|nr:hypothetical protein [Gammaproteobacteria bacterium]